jgi:acyl-CoA:acyl-CoA alkyltransferase
MAWRSERVKYQNLCLTTVAAVDGPELMSSRAIEEALSSRTVELGLQEGFIEFLSGIKERRVWPRATAPWDVAAQAGQHAIAKAGLVAADIDLLINASVCQEVLEPSASTRVHHALGLGSHCMHFDVRNACLGFLNAIDVAARFIATGGVRHALIVVGENSRGIIEDTIARLQTDTATQADLRSQFATLTLGSAGAAAIVSAADLGGPRMAAITKSHFITDSTHHALCVGNSSEMRSESRKLMEAALALAKVGFAEVEQGFGWRAEDLHRIFVHQTSYVHLLHFAQLLNVDMDRFFKVYEHHGNIGPACIPLSLVRFFEQEAVPSGSTLALMGVGSGLTCAAMELVAV